MTFTTFRRMEAHAMHSRNVNKITITLVDVANASVRLIPNYILHGRKAPLLMGSGTTKSAKLNCFSLLWEINEMDYGASLVFFQQFLCTPFYSYCTPTSHVKVKLSTKELNWYISPYSSFVHPIIANLTF